MSIYTAFDMVADCRAGKPDGWLWFARNFVPPLGVLLAHYSAAGSDPKNRLLEALRVELPGQEPAPLREMLVALRPAILRAAGYPPPVPVSALDLAILAEALDPLTVIERQVVWLETMGYDTPRTAKLMRMSAETASAVRTKAGGLLREKLGDWHIGLLREQGAALGEEARSVTPQEPVPARDYFQSVDGRVTWQRRAEIEGALSASWFEIDHFCRVREADDAFESTKPLDDAGAAPYYALLGVAPPKPGLWRRITGSRA